MESWVRVEAKVRSQEDTWWCDIWASKGREFQKGRREKDSTSQKGNKGHKIVERRRRAHTFSLNKEGN